MDLEKYKKKGKFTLSSGLKSRYYYDMKEAMGEPQNLSEMVDDIWRRINTKPDLIVGIEYGGIPLAVGLSLKMNIPYAIIRKEEKKYGTKKRVEGYQKKGRVLLVDDVVTTRSSIGEAYSYLEKNGYLVVQIETYLERDSIEQKSQN